jgi:hypothetical protein
VYDVGAAAICHPRIRPRRTVAALDPKVDDDGWDWADQRCVDVTRATSSAEALRARTSSPRCAGPGSHRRPRHGGPRIGKRNGAPVKDREGAPNARILLASGIGDLGVQREQEGQGGATRRDRGGHDGSRPGTGEHRRGPGSPGSRCQSEPPLSLGLRCMSTCSRRSGNRSANFGRLRRNLASMSKNI